jgi:hypothetical protein
MNTRRASLTHVCVDPISCLATGTRVKEINDFFKFHDLKQVGAHGLKRIGSSSANASVYCLEYKKHVGNAAYTAYAVLKTTKDEGADNLTYEYIMGKFVNELIHRHFPCFVQTYALYRYESADAKGRSRVTPLAGLHRISPDVRESCRHNDRQCLLVQYLRSPQAKTIEEYEFTRSFVQEDLPKILYQAYAVLAFLVDEFTHYDMHANNIMIYEMPTPLQFHYGSLSFCCKYMTKIIDYGRAFGKPSRDMKAQACAKCDDCGAERGYWFGDFVAKDFFIDASRPNKSHDLIYLNHLLKDRGPKIKLYHPQLFDLLELVRYDDKFGTPPRESDGVHILNVVDAAKRLKPLIAHEVRAGLTEVRVPV